MEKQTLGMLTGVGVGAGIGAGLTALYGRNGGRYRALIRDKSLHYARVAEKTAIKTARDLGNRSKGLLHPSFGKKPNARLDVLQEHWAPATRFLVGLAAAGAVAYFFLRPKPAGGGAKIARGGGARKRPFRGSEILARA